MKEDALLAAALQGDRGELTPLFPLRKTSHRCFLLRLAGLRSLDFYELGWSGWAAPLGQLPWPKRVRSDVLIEYCAETREVTVQILSTGLAKTFSLQEERPSARPGPENLKDRH